MFGTSKLGLLIRRLVRGWAMNEVANLNKYTELGFEYNDLDMKMETRGLSSAEKLK